MLIVFLNLMHVNKVNFWYTMDTYKNMRNSIVTAILMILFLGVMFGGLFHMSAGMDMGGDGNMSGCPFMSHEETLCSMSVFDHLGAWQSNFLALVPTLTLLLGALVATAVILSVAPHLIFSRRRPLHETFVLNKSREVLSFPKRTLQELFSNGILHPKLF